jgi:hypothetical protein
MAAGRSAAHTTEGAAPIIASLSTIGIAEQSLPQGLPAAILSVGSHGARETDDEEASCAGSRRSAGATRCPH